MTRNVNEVIKNLPASRRRKVEKRAANLKRSDRAKHSATKPKR